MISLGPQLQIHANYTVERMNAPYDLNVELVSGIPLLGRNDLVTFPFFDVALYDSMVTSNVQIWMSNATTLGESGMHYRNDALMMICYRLSGLNYASRDHHEMSTINTTRSDATFGVDGVPLILIEEKTTSFVDAFNDLRRKFRWVPFFGNLPFVYGIAITVSQLAIYTINHNSDFTQVFTANLNIINDRALCVKAIVNMARVLLGFIEDNLFTPPTIPIGVWTERGNGKSIRLGLQSVEIKYTAQQVDTFNRVLAFHHATVGIENLIHLLPEVVGIENNVNIPQRIIRLQPVGLTRRPNNATELVLAIRQISTCIQSLHALSYVHCDIRWANIIFVAVPQHHWVLIDCDTACSLVNDLDRLNTIYTTLAHHQNIYAPGVWTPRHDFYQIGRLIDGFIFENFNLFIELRNYLMVHEGDINIEQIYAHLNNINV